MLSKTEPRVTDGHCAGRVPSRPHLRNLKLLPPSPPPCCDYLVCWRLVGLGCLAISLRWEDAGAPFWSDFDGWILSLSFCSVNQSINQLFLGYARTQTGGLFALPIWGKPINWREPMDFDLLHNREGNSSLVGFSQILVCSGSVVCTSCLLLWFFSSYYRFSTLFLAYTGLAQRQPCTFHSKAKCPHRYGHRTKIPGLTRNTETCIGDTSRREQAGPVPSRQRRISFTRWHYQRRCRPARTSPPPRPGVL